jgi:hypothetical protein
MSSPAILEIGNHLITRANLIELNQIFVRGLQMTEEMDAMASRCCEILGVDPSAESLAKDFAEEIALFATPPHEAIRNLQQHLE